MGVENFNSEILIGLIFYFFFRRKCQGHIFIYIVFFLTNTVLGADTNTSPKQSRKTHYNAKRIMCHIITAWSEARVSRHFAFGHICREPFSKKFAWQLNAEASSAVFCNSSRLVGVCNNFIGKRSTRQHHQLGLLCGLIFVYNHVAKLYFSWSWAACGIKKNE